LSAICPPGLGRLRLGMRTVGLGAIGVVLAVACGQPHPTPKASASATPSAGAGASLPAWRACGSDVVPPASVLAAPKLPVKVDASRTNGTVSQREADRWAAAFLREQAIEGWAVTTNRDAVLKSGCLGPVKSYDNTFGPEVATMAAAKAAGGHLAYEPAATVVAMSVVPASSAAQEYVGTLSGITPQFALAVTDEGPLAAYIVDQSGNRLQQLGHTDAGVRYEQAYFGSYTNQGLGPLWYQLAAGDCRSAWMSRTCGA
jgi:hypothetical protein